MSTDTTTVYVVDVDERVDELYVFAREDDAERFAAAVEEAGGAANVAAVPLISDPATLDALIRVEAGEEGVTP